MVFRYARCLLSTRSVSRCLPLRCLFNTSTSHLMSDELSVRLAQEQDFQGILQTSEGVYDGRDYLPFVFHQWLKTPGNYMFVGDLHGKIIGFQANTVIDGGQTIYSQSIRVHPEYRGRGYSYRITAEAIKQVLRFTPGASKVRLTSDQNNPRTNATCRKMGYKALMHRRQFSFQVDKSTCRAFLTSHWKGDKQLHAISIKEAVKLVLHEKKFDHVIANGIFVVAYSPPCEIMPANAEFIFEEGDMIFMDLTADQLADGCTPRSLSRGRLVKTVNQQTWISNIYAKEKEVFRSHLIRQVMASVEQVGGDGRQSILEVYYDEEAGFDGREVLQEIFGSSPCFSIVSGSFDGNMVAWGSSLVKKNSE